MTDETVSSSATPSPAAPSPAAPRPRHGVDPRLLELLVCPVSRGPLDYDADAMELVSRKAGLAYPIKDGIPVMLEGEARVLDAP